MTRDFLTLIVRLCVCVGGRGNVCVYGDQFGSEHTRRERERERERERFGERGDRVEITESDSWEPFERKEKCGA